MSPCLVAALSSLSMNEVTEGELENLCSLEAKDRVPEAALKSACAPLLCVGAYRGARVPGMGTEAIFAGASMVGSPCPSCVSGTSMWRI